MSDKDLEVDLELDQGTTTGRMMLIIGLFAGLAVGGAGAFFWFQSQGDEEADTQETVEEELVEEEKEPDVLYSYLYVERMPAALVDENGRTVGYVFLDFTFELLNSEDQSYVSGRMPRVKDAMLRAISKHGLTRPGSRGELDYDRVSAFLLEAVNTSLDTDKVKGVYITRALRAPS